MSLDVPLRKTVSASRRHGLTTTPIYGALEGASQTFKKGAPLVFNSSGYLIEASNPVATNEAIVGFATSDGNNGSAGAYGAHYIPALSNMIFEGVLEDATNFSHALLQANLGQAYPLAKDTVSGAWFLDENGVGDACAVIIELVDAVSTVIGRVRFIVLPSRTLYN
jgi:hypothetical protein